MRSQKSAKAVSYDDSALLLRGILAVLVQRERRDGVTMDDLAATLKRGDGAR